MSETRILAALRRLVIERAAHRCEYCGVPNTAYLAPHEPDHVIAEQHGGTTEAANLAYACFRCNRLKGPNLASLDPASGVLTRLYNPRADLWDQYFKMVGATIDPLSGVGRATAYLLRFNDEQSVALRAELLRQGRYVPPQTP